MNKLNTELGIGEMGRWGDGEMGKYEEYEE
jgi:hypothetical protein